MWDSNPQKNKPFPLYVIPYSVKNGGFEPPFTCWILEKKGQLNENYIIQYFFFLKDKMDKKREDEIIYWRNQFFA